MAKNKAKKRKQQTDPVELTSEEQKRRRLQKEKRELALKLRAEGKEYKSKHKSRPPKWEREAAKSGKLQPSRKEGEASTGARKKHGSKAQPVAEPGSGKLVKPGEIEVIIVPLFWKQREAEREAITGAALEVRKLFEATGVASFVDFSNKLNPGQKYRYWEERGVKLRVELGPKDLESNSCVLAISNKPGEVATKHSVAFGEELLRHTGESLGRDLSLEGSGYEPKAFQAPKETPKGKHMSFGDAADDEDVEGSEQETVGAGSVPVSDASVWRSGDDLGDDFALFSSEGDGKKTKKKGF